MNRRGWLVAGCLVAAIAAQAQTAPASAKAVAAGDPEQHLKAIRDALVESTLAAPVRVQSFGWIDSEGRLHESTQFTSDARVRGVRVQSYVEDPAAARVKVDLDVLPTGLVRQAEADPQRCLDSQRRWRQALHVEVSTASDLPLGMAGLMLPVAASTRQAFLEAARDSRRWIAQARPAQPASAYEKALFWRDADRTEWLARIEIGGRVTAPVARIELGPLNQPGPGRRLQMPLPGPGSHPQALALAMADAVADLERQMACEPVWYTVAGSGEQLRLREGVPHGLQAGDRLLLVERQYLPSRLLEPGATRALALVQVGTPSPSGTPLRWLAGPRPSQEGEWVALPL